MKAIVCEFGLVVALRDAPCSGECRPLPCDAGSGHRGEVGCTALNRREVAPTCNSGLIRRRYEVASEFKRGQHLCTHTDQGPIGTLAVDSEFARAMNALSFAL